MYMDVHKKVVLFINETNVLINEAASFINEMAHLQMGAYIYK